MQPNGARIASAVGIVTIAIIGFVSPARAGVKWCWAMGTNGSANTCDFGPFSTGKCTIQSIYLSFDASCLLCTIGKVRCDLAACDGNRDYRINLYTTGKNFRDEQSPPLGTGFKGCTGTNISVGCENLPGDTIQVSMFGNCT